MELVLKMPFFTFNNVNIAFAESKLAWKLHIAAKAYPTIRFLQFT